eukprot:TRINITY_DN8204_c0_g1_i4.p1 TRINITY_DN8204_c0_g1~~TRINITY_DN8204_c0_g1_i4.p1  ORF type:complete len:145 (+),score=28.24 TRINITY_DN8204_c0_g1_i4:187-621(+)
MWLWLLWSVPKQARTAGALDPTLLRFGLCLIYKPFYLDSFMAWAMMAAARLLVGFVLLVVTRQVGKTLAQGLIIRLLPESEVSYKQRYAVGVPVKFITYSLVGFVCVLHGPVLFEALQLNSDTVVAIDKWLLTTLPMLNAAKSI